MKPSKILGLAACIVLPLMSAQVQAQIHSLETYGYANFASGGTCITDHGNIGSPPDCRTQQFSTSAWEGDVFSSSASTVWGGKTAASMVSVAQFGAVHGVAHSDAIKAAGGYQVAQSRTQGSNFADQIIATSSSYNYAVHISGSHGQTTDGMGMTDSLWFNGLVSVQVGTDFKNWSATGTSNSPVVLHDDGLITGTISGLTLGQSFVVKLSVDSWSYVETIRGDTSLSTFADYAATLNLDPNSPGGGKAIGYSGHDYSTAAVPEPQSLWLMLAGLAVLCRLQLRRRFV